MIAFLALVANVWFSGNWHTCLKVPHAAPAGSSAVNGPETLVNELIRPPTARLAVIAGVFWNAVVYGMPAKEASAVPF